MKTETNVEIPVSKADRPTAFAHDVIWVAVAQLFNSFILGIATLPALTKHYNPEIYGIWIQIMVTVSLLSPVFAMELDMAVVRFLAGEEDKLKRRKAVGSMFFAIASFCALAFLVVNLMVSPISNLLFDSPDYTTFVRLAFLWVITDALFVFFSAYFRSQNRIRLLAVRLMAYSVLIMVIVIVLTSLGLGLEPVVACVIAAQGILALFFFIMIVKEIGWPLPNVSGLKQFLAFSLPQIPGTSLLWLIASSDRYFITHFLGLSQVGIYSSSNQLAILTRLFYAPVCYVLYPSLSRLWDENRFAEVRTYLQYAIRLLLTLGIPASVGVALLSQPLLKLLATPEFLAGKALVLFISLGTVLLGIYQINGQVILLAKRTKLLPLIIGAASATSVVMNILLIPHIGIIGAAISNFGAYFVLALIVTLMAKKAANYFPDFRFLAKVIAATIPMAACLYFLPVNGIPGIILAVILGSAIYGAGLLLLRAFSESEKQLIKRTLNSLKPGYKSKNIQI